MTVVICPLTSNEIPALLRLVAEYWIFEDIARAGHDAAGYLLAVYVFSLEHLGLTAEIDEFFVLPSFRGREIGRENDRGRASYCEHG